MTQNYFAPSGSTKPGKPAKQRFSEVALRTAKIKGRLFENLPKARDSASDFEPLYSSFAANAQFRPPVSSKDVLQMKLLQRQRGLLGANNLARERQPILKPQEASQVKAEPEGKGGLAAAASAAIFQGAAATGAMAAPDGSVDPADAKQPYADQVTVRASTEELPLPMVT